MIVGKLSDEETAEMLLNMQLAAPEDSILVQLLSRWAQRGRKGSADQVCALLPWLMQGFCPSPVETPLPVSAAEVLSLECSLNCRAHHSLSTCYALSFLNIILPFFALMCCFCL